MTDEFEISHAAYGKSTFGALSWTRSDGAGSVRDVTFRVLVEGEFLDSYRSGDNRAVLPSETLRRHAVDECAAHPDAEPEKVAELIAARLLAANPAFTSVTVGGEVRTWRAIGAHTFTLDPGRDEFELHQNRLGTPRLTAGLNGLTILLTAGSRFTGFRRDELTSQVESTDRPVLGSVAANWTYQSPGDTRPAEMAAQLAAALADRSSNSIQQWITDAASRLLEANAALASLRISFTSSALVETADGVFAGADHPAGETTVELRRGA